MAEPGAPSPQRSSAALAGLGLDEPVCELVRPTVDEWAVRRMWEGIQCRRSPLPGRERPHVVALAAFAAVASMLALILASAQLIASLRAPAAAGAAGPGSAAASAPASPGGAPAAEPLLTRDARRFEVLEAPPALEGSDAAATARVEFADGSSIEASPGARVEALASSGDEFAVVVRRGLAQFRVTPGGPRRWRIDASHARVEVLGTVLWVESDDGGTTVRVDVGRVRVHSPELPGGSREVGAGEALRLGAAPPAPSGARAGAPPRAHGAAKARRPRRATPERARPLEPRPEAALDEPAPARAPVRSTAGVATAAAALWEGADEARRNGEHARAAALLTELVEQYPADSQVALAAFTLGVLELEHLAHPFEASEWFQRALELGLGAALREDAYLRWAEALSRSRARARLLEVSAEYERLYPHGRHAAAIEALASAPSPAASRASAAGRAPAAPRGAAGSAAPARGGR